MTAVEWLIEQILEIPLDDSTNAAHLKKYVCKVSVFEKAKEIEKEQLRKTYDIGLVYDYGFDWMDMKVKTFEQYYNETYKSKNDENT